MKKNQINRSLSAVLVASVSLFLGGCGTTPKPLLYSWGGYQKQVHEHFKGEDVQEQIKALEEGVQKAQASGTALPPGFRAHLALLYGDTGNTQKFVDGLEQEKAAFPESAGFMDYLLSKTKAK